MSELKDYVKEGMTVLIENVGTSVPRKLYPLFTWVKGIAQTGNKQRNIYLDKRMMHIDPHFKMYITSNISNPDFGSEISLMANFINFGVTIEAFEAQILAILLANQEKEIFEKQKIYRHQALLQMQELRLVEENIIEEVSKQKDYSVIIEGNILTEKLV